MVVVGQLLARTGVGVVKGATNLEVRVGTARTRVSSDLDTVRRASLEEFRDRLAESLRVGWEGFTGVVADRGPVDTPAPAAYRPHRLRVRLMYRGGDFASFTIEVSPEEIGALGEPEAITSQEAVGWCEALGLPTQASIPALPLAHQVAQKLHACTAPDTDDWTNDRVYDLVDLQIAMDGYTGDYRDIKAAAVRLFSYRNGHPWPPTVTARDGWADRYLQETAGLTSSRASTRRSLGPTTAWRGSTAPDPFVSRGSSSSPCRRERRRTPCRSALAALPRCGGTVGTTHPSRDGVSYQSCLVQRAGRFALRRAGHRPPIPPRPPSARSP